MDVSREELAAISRFFSSSVVRELARKGRSPLLARLAAQTSLPARLAATDCVGCLFDGAFNLLKKEGLRHEYIYKAALTHKVLLGGHSLRTASMLTEFRVGERKVDLAILNGTASAYEVKSERDSLSRLVKQLAAYSQVFAKVYVIAAESHVGAVLDVAPEHVGLLRLNTRHQISSVRQATDRTDQTLPAAIFDSIRIHEARMILLASGVPVPEVPNTVRHSVLRELFGKLKPRDAHQGMVKVLKRTRNLLPLSSLISQLPHSLQPAALSVSFRKADHQRLVVAVNTPLKDAMNWA